MLASKVCLISFVLHVDLISTFLIPTLPFSEVLSHFTTLHHIHLLLFPSFTPYTLCLPHSLFLLLLLSSSFYPDTAYLGFSTIHSSGIHWGSWNTSPWIRGENCTFCCVGLWVLCCVIWQNIGKRPGTRIFAKTFELPVEKSSREINVLTLTNLLLGQMLAMFTEF